MSQPFAIVGAGSLGQSFAALLARAGEHVTLLATPRSANRLRASGVITLGGTLDAVVPVSDATARAVTNAPPGPGAVVVATSPTDLPHDALVLFTTKGHDLPAAIEAVRSAAGNRVAWAAGVQNGIVKDDLLANAFGAERVVGAVTIFGAQRETNRSGIVRVTSSGATYLGELDGHTSDRVRRAADRLQAAGIPTQARDDIASVLWSKACNATGVFGVTVLTRVSNQRLFADRHLMRAYLALVRETAAVAAAYGVQIGDYAGFPPIGTFVNRDDDATIDLLPPTVPALNGEPAFASMTQDLLGGQPLEVDAVFGDIVERAERKHVPVPSLRLVRDLIRGLDAANRASVTLGAEQVAPN
jgi:2-dehydropantoate 2-reductase